MPRLALFLGLLLAIASPTLAQPSDFEQVETTVSYYLDGGTANDFELLSRAFHPTATMRWIGREGYTDVNAVDYFREIMRPGPPQNRETRVVSIDVSGNAANAILEIDYPTFTFVDYMTLLKIDGEWKIVSKAFYQRMHPETGS
ncbi:MAG: nuclear transport factor 2 family protein [Bacteroidota bacterium]